MVPTLRRAAERWLNASQAVLIPIRPSGAPKQSPDIKSIRGAVDHFVNNCESRNYAHLKFAALDIEELSSRVSSLKRSIVDTRRTVKQLEKDLVVAKGEKDEVKATSILTKIKPLRDSITAVEEEQTRCEKDIHDLALILPNLTSKVTPVGDHPKHLEYLNYDEAHPPSFGEDANHSVIGQKLDLLDFSSASIATGWGFYYLLNEAAQLEQALVQYALRVAMRRGWRMVTPPSVVYSHIADSCGFQPRDQNGEQQIWSIAQAEKDQDKPSRSLAATAEIPLATLYASKDIPQEQLPIKLVGVSRCYRAEAGARGVDSKGLYRVHEFTKVEMFAWTDSPVNDHFSPGWTKASQPVFEEMLAIQKEILTSLNLPCRILEMPTEDLGASAYRKIDIEALFPSRMSRNEGWGEVSSVSICTDYQSRRLDTRIKAKDGGRLKFPHTINGTALAVPRVLAAILENGWRQDEGIVVVPEPLRPYMCGMTHIGPKGEAQKAQRDGQICL